MAEGGKTNESESPYSNPVYKKISLKNGEINKLSYSKLRKLAKSLNMCVEGSTDILRKRLKSHYFKMYLSEAEVKTPKKPYKYYIVIDFEATCEDKFSTQIDFPHEIIEFPAVIVNSETFVIDSVFHEYVRPVLNKTLSEYCVSLTGVSQSQVDSADTFHVVLERFEKWMQCHDLIGESAIVTDGPWDMARFLYTQVKLSGLPYPKFAKRWVNLKKTFSNFYNQRKPTLDIMLQQLNFEFEGRRHCGIDDTRNISRVLIQLLKDGACVQVNERIDLSSFQSRAFHPISEIVKPVKGEVSSWCKDDTSPENLNGENKDCSKEANKELEREGVRSEAIKEDDVFVVTLDQNISVLSSLSLATRDDNVLGNNHKCDDNGRKEVD